MPGVVGAGFDLGQHLLCRGGARATFGQWGTRTICYMCLRRWRMRADAVMTKISREYSPWRLGLR